MTVEKISNLRAVFFSFLIKRNKTDKLVAKPTEKKKRERGLK